VIASSVIATVLCGGHVLVRRAKVCKLHRIVPLSTQGEHFDKQKGDHIAISHLVSVEAVPQIGNIVVKRKYKRLPGNKIRWWFLVYMEEDSLQKLESEWEGP